MLAFVLLGIYHDVCRANNTQQRRGQQVKKLLILVCCVCNRDIIQGVAMGAKSSSQEIQAKHTCT